MNDTQFFVKGGTLEIYAGPMKSGKTQSLIHRVDMLKHVEGVQFVMFKPNVDTRSEHIQTRNHNLTCKCVVVSAEHPDNILLEAEDADIIGIDEAQFFSNKLIGIVRTLLNQNKHIIVSGLDLDFRGEPFGPMPVLLSMAHIVQKLHGVCDFTGCTRPGTRTQRLVNGIAAPYTSPIVLVGDVDEGYQVRCMKHHDVPGKPEAKETHWRAYL